MEPDSRMGTSMAMTAAGEPNAVSTHVSTVFGFISTSPSLVHVCAAMMARALCFCCGLSVGGGLAGTEERLVKNNGWATFQRGLLMKSGGSTYC